MMSKGVRIGIMMIDTVYVMLNLNLRSLYKHFNPNDTYNSDLALTDSPVSYGKIHNNMLGKTWFTKLKIKSTIIRCTVCLMGFMSAIVSDVDLFGNLLQTLTERE